MLALAVIVLAAYPWPQHGSTDTLATRFAPPPGYSRAPADPASLAAFLRGLPLLPGRPTVRLFDGRPKGNQEAHVAVVDLDVGTADLQQCADAAMRLLAEYQWSSARRGEVCFTAEDGTPLAWARYASGERPRLRGQRLAWAPAAAPDGSYQAFRRYLDVVFAYASTRSLSRELTAVADPSRPEAGDVFIRAGSPGHAVIVLDVAENEAGGRVFLLGQSYMPAQSFQVLRNPAGDEPWYEARRAGELVTPEWRFTYADLRRAVGPGCRRD